MKNVIVESWRRMFKRDKPTEEQAITALRTALGEKDTKLTITSGDGNTWTFYNDKLRGCFLKIGRSKIVEDDKQDVSIKFVMFAINGRVG